MLGRGSRRKKPCEHLYRRDFPTMSADEGGDTTPMPATNGEPHLESGVVMTPGKRKRSAPDEKSGADSNASAAREKANLHDNLRSLVELLLK